VSVNTRAEVHAAEPAGGGVVQCSFFFPTSAPEGPSGRRRVPFARQPGGELAGLRVLVVEDDPDARELVSTILEDAGAVVRGAESAANGFAAVGAFHPHLLVSDIGMPDEDGYSLIRRVRALGVEAGGGIPSVALTAFTRPEDRAKALTAGFTVHMGKPINPSELIRTLKELATATQH